MLQEELVNVAVPRSRLAEVYALLGSAPVATSSVVGGTQGPEEDGWTDELIDRAYRESAGNMRQVIDHLVAHADQWVSAEDLARALQVTQPQVRGVLGAFGHRMHSRYKVTRWPCDYRWDNEAGTSFYRMSKERAELFKQARVRS